MDRMLRRLIGEDVAVRSAPGLGATFKILLPLVVGETTAEGGRAETGSQTPAGEATLLLAENENAVRRFLATSLRSQGYHFVEGPTASKPWNQASACPGPTSSSRTS